MEVIITHRSGNSYTHSERGYNAMIKSAKKSVIPRVTTILISQISFGVVIKNIC